jgi:hypothetical protein
MGACCVMVTTAVCVDGAQKKCVPAKPPHEISPSCVCVGWVGDKAKAKSEGEGSGSLATYMFVHLDRSIGQRGDIPVGWVLPRSRR